MAAAKETPRELRKVAKIGAEIAGHRAAIEALYGALVREIHKASDAGASRRAVAAAAGLTAGRVQQILDGRDLAARHRGGGR